MNKQETETKVDHNYHEQPSSRKNTELTPEYKEYRRRWEENPKDHILERFPIHLDIEATSKCNLKCVMCPRTEMVKDGTFWKSEDVDFDTYKRLIDEGVEKGLCSLKLNSLGEPLLNKRLVEMIRYAKDRGVMDVMFNTNAYFLNRDMAEDLIESGLDKLFFSFDSPYRERYNDIRVNSDYDTVLYNIERFHSIRDDMESATPSTRISMVRMDNNEEEWIDFLILFKPIVDAVAWVDYVVHSNKDSPPAPPSTTEEKKFCCPQLWQRTFIHPDGVVTVCCVDSAREIQVGNINNQSIEEIWQNPAYTKLRDLHESGRIDEIPTCSTCHLAQIK